MSEVLQLADQLNGFIPPLATEMVADFLVNKNAQLTISKPRKTKLGDYRPPLKKAYHRVSVNGDLNPFAFLLVTIHEFAHLLVWDNHKNSAKIHGMEWKMHYKQLYKEYQHCFPENLQTILNDHFKKLSAATLNNPMLIRNLIHMDSDVEITMVNDLKKGDIFDFNDKKFKIIEKRRTRYLCKNIDSGKKYLVSGVAIVNRANE